MLNTSAFKEIYDWFYRSYGETSRERLLELMKNAVGIQHLKQLSQPDLAKFYSEGLAYTASGPDRNRLCGKRAIIGILGPCSQHAAPARCARVVCAVLPKRSL